MLFKTISPKWNINELSAIKTIINALITAISMFTFCRGDFRGGEICCAFDSSYCQFKFSFDEMSRNISVAFNTLFRWKETKSLFVHLSQKVCARLEKPHFLQLKWSTTFKEKSSISVKPNKIKDESHTQFDRFSPSIWIGTHPDITFNINWIIAIIFELNIEKQFRWQSIDCTPPILFRISVLLFDHNYKLYWNWLIRKRCMLYIEHWYWML